jgi:hypothetical protein
MIRGRAIFFKVSYNIFTSTATMINFLVISFMKIKTFRKYSDKIRCIQFRFSDNLFF